MVVTPSWREPKRTHLRSAVLRIITAAPEQVPLDLLVECFHHTMGLSAGSLCAIAEQCPDEDRFRLSLVWSSGGDARPQPLCKLGRAAGWLNHHEAFVHVPRRGM